MVKSVKHIYCGNAEILKFQLISWCRDAQFLRNFRRIAQNSAETVHFHRIFKQGN